MPAGLPRWDVVRSVCASTTSSTTSRTFAPKPRVRSSSTGCSSFREQKSHRTVWRGRKNSHIIALDIQRYISADQSADEILREIRRQNALSIACHPHHRTTRRIEISTCYLWDHREQLSDLVDVWEAANRDDLFSVTSLKHYPYVANSDFHKPKHLYSWKTLVRSEKNWPAVSRALRDNVDIALTLFRNGSVAEPPDRIKSIPSFRAA